MKKIIYILLPFLIGTGCWSCSDDYLDEESYGATIEIFDSQEGSEALVNLLYTKINDLYSGYNFGYLTENGSDIWLRAQNNGAVTLTEYKGLDAYDGTVSWFWNHCYKALWDTNLFLETIDKVPYDNEELKKSRKAEMLVLQAYFYWVVTETFGDVYLPLSTDEQEGLEARRSTREDFYKKIISNLDTAIQMLPATRSSEYGRIDQGAAKAFLARVYLYHEEWDKAVELSSEVINDYGYELCPSWTDLWNGAKRNNEFIWTVENSADEAFGGGSSQYWQAFNMFIDRFAGVKTELHWSGYGGCQLMPSKHYLSLFNRKADLRWADGFQWVWYYNDPADDTSAFPHMTQLYKDTALYLGAEPFTAQQREYMKTHYTAFDINDMYDEKGVPKDRFTFICLKKYNDDMRPSDMSTLSSRCYPILRLGEMYLIRAEANIRKASPDRKAAADDINLLRKRITAPGSEQAMTVSEKDMTLDFILDERARELGGENQRWFDLKRTGSLIKNVTAYNPDAAPYIKDYHTVRPVPQGQFDGMPDYTTLGQNPGY